LQTQGSVKIVGNVAKDLLDAVIHACRPGACPQVAKRYAEEFLQFFDLVLRVPIAQIL
jgi:hypothetical protein